MSETTLKKLTTGFSASRLAKTDAELIGACRRGDEAARDELVDRYQRLIYTVPLRAGLSEDQSADVLQEVFLTLLHSKV